MSRTKLTKKIKKQIAEYIATGLTLPEALNELGNPVKAQTARKAKISDPYFKELMDNAYQCQMEYYMDELDRLSKLTASEEYPLLEFKEGEATLKRRVDAVKFILAKTAGYRSKAYDKASKVEHSGIPDNTPQIIVQTYSVPSDDDIDTQSDHSTH